MIVLGSINMDVVMQVAPLPAPRPDQPTGTAYVAIASAGENQILVAGGANRTVDTA